jgi:hypothetical protein
MFSRTKTAGLGQGKCKGASYRGAGTKGGGAAEPIYGFRVCPSDFTPGARFNKDGWAGPEWTPISLQSAKFIYYGARRVQPSWNIEVLVRPGSPGAAGEAPPVR